MEYIGGTSLAERPIAGPACPADGRRSISNDGASRPLRAWQGIVHRRSQPANVLLDENDQPKVTDFGLAKQLETESDQTRTGAILAPPAICPPSSRGSKDITPGQRCLQSGAVLYELVTASRRSRG